MYICLENISKEELKKVKAAIKEIISDDVDMRLVSSIYKEIAWIEIESTIGAEIDDEQVDQLSKKQLNRIIDDLSTDLAYEFEDTVFQDMCDKSREMIERYSTDNLFDKEYLQTISR